MIKNKLTVVALFVVSYFSVLNIVLYNTEHKLVAGLVLLALGLFVAENCVKFIGKYLPKL